MADHPAILTDPPPVLDMKLHPFAAWQGATLKGYFSTWDLAMKIAREGDTSWQARVVDMRDGTVWA